MLLIYFIGETGSQRTFTSVSDLMNGFFLLSEEWISYVLV